MTTQIASRNCTAVLALSSCGWLYHILVKIQRKKIKFTLQQSTKAQRGSRGIALLFL